MRLRPDRSRWGIAGVAMAMLVAPLATPAKDILVRDQAAFERAAAQLKPGDTLVMADGEWRDFELVFTANGRPGQPVTLTAQTPGQVVLTGRSNLRMSGEHLVVSNLVFRDGHSPTGEVFSFRTSTRERAVHSRATGIVIDRFNNPDRRQSDHWVALYGHDNRFDHGHLVGKTNAGTTLVVVRDAKQGLDNRHRIDHVWFGPRPNLGANGGETIRVGTSHDSLSDSHTVVEDNWFEGCDGEVEIVSNKSGGNTYRGNVFLRSRGALVLRHGDGNLVEGNVFLGDGKPHTGGVRVINRRQTVRGNHFQGLRGSGFAAALSVMYGVPDSPLNRYVQVDGAVIERNTFVDVSRIVLGTGKDEERSLAPVDSRFASNLVVGDSDPFVVEGDVSGIAFAGNVQSPAASTHLPADGVQGRTVALRDAADGLRVPADAVDAGAPAIEVVPREAVGVPWYRKETADPGFDGGTTRHVSPGEGTLARAVSGSAAGDRIVLAPGRYLVDEVLPIDHPLTISGPVAGEASIAFSRSVLFDIARGGSLLLQRLQVTGSAAPDQAGNAVIHARPGAGAANYRLALEDVAVKQLTVNRGFNVIALGKDTLADSVVLTRVRVEDVSGSVLSAASETDDQGTYNSERVVVADSAFARIAGPVLDVYRGGTDESTFGPDVRVTGSRFDRVGGASVPSLRLQGVQYAELAGNRFERSGAVRFATTVGTPVLVARDNDFIDTPGIVRVGKSGAVQ